MARCEAVDGEAVCACNSGFEFVDGACLPPENWVFTFGGEGGDSVGAIVSDAAGQLYIAGGTQGGEFGDELLQGGGHNDALVGSLNAAGQPRWVQHYAFPGHQIVEALASSEDQLFAAGSPKRHRDGAPRRASGAIAGTNLDPW